MITNTTSSLIKYVKKLNQKKYRTEFKQYLVEGKHLVDEAYQLNLIDTIFGLEESTEYENVRYFQVSDEVMKVIANVMTPQGIVAVCNTKETEDISDKILVLDGIQDPGNLGTILRSAVAFGFNTVVSENTVDVYNEKVIRSSQGAIFKVNYITANLLEFLSTNEKDYYIYGTDVLNGEKLSQIDFNKNKLMLILGNEGSGVREEIKQKANLNIHIEMENTESLNVSIAASIIMYEIYKG